MQKKTATVRILIAILVLSMMLPIGVSAEEVQPRASYYLDSYSSYVYLPGTGEVRVYFHVEGTNIMDEIGALRVELYESKDGSNWSWVDTFNHYSTAGMLSYVDDYHSGYVSYDGVAGRYYKAYVTVWAGRSGDGDSRSIWTTVKH